MEDLDHNEGGIVEMEQQIKNLPCPQWDYIFPDLPSSDEICCHFLGREDGENGELFSEPRNCLQDLYYFEQHFPLKILVLLLYLNSIGALGIKGVKLF